MKTAHYFLFQYPIKTRRELRDFYFCTIQPTFAWRRRAYWDYRSIHSPAWCQ